MEQSSSDTRDLVVKKLQELERKLPWLANKTGISYPTLYDCIAKKGFNLSFDNLTKINEALGTDFPLTKTKRKNGKIYTEKTINQP